MKINKNNPVHWILLCTFGFFACIGLFVRVFTRRRAGSTVILYGHKLNGNLLAIYQELTNADYGIRPIFLSMDRSYCRQLRADGIECQWAASIGCIGLLAHADAVISDHGLHVMQFLVGRTDLLFFDVWHGFGFKGHDPSDFRVLHRYDEVWVSSPLQAQFYRQKFGFIPSKVHATGYARTDRLVRQTDDVQRIKQQLGLDGAGIGKLVLFAPTWQQDNPSRSMYPFGLSADEFLGSLSRLAQRTTSTIAVRAHLNNRTANLTGYPRVVAIPSADFPDTEGILLASDVLVCDWSSIAFDWLLLDRPTLFLDVEPPFAKGFTLDASYRYGELVSSMEQLVAALEHCLRQPGAYRATHGSGMARTRAAVFGGCADGWAARRCVERLHERLAMPHGRRPS